MTRKYYANGKLLLSGEYMVLHGASSIVLPLKPGQFMSVVDLANDPDPYIHWEARVFNETWFYTDINISKWNYFNTNNEIIASRLLNLLYIAGIMNPQLFASNSYNVFTNTNFDMNWGFGSSSALIANISQWSLTDPFELYFRANNGSGADIAGAISKGPVLYKLDNGRPEFHQIKFKPDFYPQLWFVYTGQKQDTSATLNSYFDKPNIDQRNVEQINIITHEMIKQQNIESFMNLIKEHELVISKILEKPRIKESLFPDFNGEIKSMGSWGGDFVLAVSKSTEETIRNYFSKRGLKIIFSFDELIL